MVEPTTPLPGARIGEELQARYRLLRLLGSGAMGEVYEAEHMQIGRRVAIKLLWPEHSRDTDQVERFQREARVGGLVASPHIVDVLDAGRLGDGTRYLVMELLRGVTLADELEQRGPLPIARACLLVKQIATGLAAAHSAGIVHRDLKPDNVFLVAQVDSSDWIKILDFGVSKVRRGEGDLELTRTGTAIGTPTYMSPEQAEGARSVDARADIWSIGVILYKMLTGELPFTASNYTRLVIKIATELAPRIRPRRQDVPNELERLVHRCLEKAPADRYASATSLIADLDQITALMAAGTASFTDEPLSRTRVDKSASGTGEWPSSRRDGVMPLRGLGIPTDISPEDLPFDEVVLEGPNGGRRVPALVFFQLPLSERIRQVIARTVRFIRGGVEVDRHDALAKMRMRSAR